MLGTSPAVVAITGGSRGIGAALVSSLAAGGDQVYVLARNQHPDSVPDPGPGRITSIHCDVSDPASVAAAFAELGRTSDVLDGLVLNAGVSPTRRRAHRLEPALWESIVAVNLTGAFSCAHHAHPLLTASAAPRVVLTSSVMPRKPLVGLTAYAASKAGVDGLTTALAVDWADDGILVNAVALGFFETDLSLPLRSVDDHGASVTELAALSRWGRVEELVGAYELLLSPRNSYMTGTVVRLDGGYLLG